MRLIVHLLSAQSDEMRSSTYLKKGTPGRRDNWAVYDLIDSFSENLVWMLKTPRLFALFAFHNGWIIYGCRSYSLCSRDFVRESIHHYDICRSSHVILINGENFILPRDKLDMFIAVFLQTFFLFRFIYGCMKVCT